MLPAANEWNHNVDWFGNCGYQIPPPNAMVRYVDGSMLPLMFHYLPAEVSFREVAAQNGFDIKHVEMEDDLAEDDPIWVDYFENGDGDAINRWNPTTFEGWQFAGKLDGEDGPFAIYLKPQEKKDE